MIRALAEAGDLALADDEVGEVLPWFRYVYAGLRGLRQLAEALPPDVEPYPLAQQELPYQVFSQSGSGR
jgi:hypothetical protein